MKILNYGSLNLDLTYQVDHLVRPGETLAAASFTRYCGGKGLNQSVALAKAGACVYHGGKIGYDGAPLLEALTAAGANTQFVFPFDGPSGHAMIQVDSQGQNSILLFGGANREVQKQEIHEALHSFTAGDWLLLQNEINEIPYLMEQAKEKGMHIAFNPAPMEESVKAYPLHLVDLFVVNETEAMELTGETREEEALAAMEKMFPHATHLVTLGSKGSLCSQAGKHYAVSAEKVKAIDTTGAGDTYIGYFLAMIMEGKELQNAMEIATHAAAIAVSRPGASPSIPYRKEVLT